MPRTRSKPPPVVAEVTELVRAGYGALLTFESPGAWVELAGPNGARSGDGETWRAPVTTVRLMRAGERGVIATAARDEAFGRSLDAIAELARPFAGADHRDLVAVLRAVRELAAKPRTRMPTVGPDVVEHGEPALSAWLSCLTLADLEQALAESCEEAKAA